jgi:D-3-phosphoglycerate dehydrogenase
VELVYIVDPIHDAGVEAIRAQHEIILPEQGRSDPRLERATIIVVRTSEIEERLIARVPGLKLIVKHGAGVDNIDLAAATRHGVWVASTPGGANSTAVAEGAVALMLAVLRRTCEMDALVRSGRFDTRWQVRLGDLTGARVGLVGFGRIARVVAKICGAGFGADVAACDPMVPAGDMRTLGVTPLNLPELMERDVISVHVPLAPGTRNLIGAAELERMHRAAIIVNTSRGGVINEAALAGALAAGAIGGAGLDVFEQEPPPDDHPLFALPNVVLGPHIAGVTEASMKGMALAVASIIETVLGGERPATLINPQVCEAQQ